MCQPLLRRGDSSQRLRLGSSPAELMAKLGEHVPRLPHRSGIAVRQCSRHCRDLLGREMSNPGQLGRACRRGV
jgi:hypothetical protein